MRPPGRPLGPDAVLVWTDAHELTRFERDGTRARFTLPFAPLAAQIGRDAVFAVDERGSTHRFSLAGEHQAFVPLLESPGRIAKAAVSADGSRLAILAGEVQVFEHGQLRAWPFEHRGYAGARETGVDISHDGRSVLVRYESPPGENLGDEHHGVTITRDDGVLIYREFARQLPPLELAMSFDAQHVAVCEHETAVRIMRTTSMSVARRIDHGHVRRFRWFEDSHAHLLGVLYDDRLLLANFELSEAWLALPEQFEDLVFNDNDVVCIHRELGAWWIGLDGLEFTSLAG